MLRTYATAALTTAIVLVTIEDTVPVNKDLIFTIVDLAMTTGGVAAIITMFRGDNA